MNFRRLFISVTSASLMTGVPSSGQHPSPHLRPVGELPGLSIDERPNVIARMPNDRIVFYATDTALYAYDLAARKSAVVARGSFGGLAVSPAGDRLAWHRAAEPPAVGRLVWSMTINPRTGASTGAEAMVSTIHGNTPRFSPDGKLIAFESGSSNPAVIPETLIVVPSNGGPERRVATFTVHVHPDWSSDGKSLLVHTTPGEREQWVDRVPLAGGASQRVFSIPEAQGAGGAILGTDGHIAFYQRGMRDGTLTADASAISYVTASGEHGDVRVPFGAKLTFDAGVPRSGTIAIDREPTTAYALDVTTGKVRSLMPSEVEGRDPSWSRDGKKLALQTWNGSRYDITVMDGDGSNRRTYPVALDVTNGQMDWSPNGRYLLFRVGRRDDHGMIDLATGAARVLAYRSGTSQGWTWRADSKAVIIARNKAASDRPHAYDEQLAVYEVTLDGRERLLRDLSNELPGHVGATFVSDHMLALASREKRVLVPVNGGPVRTIPGPGAGRNAGFNTAHTAYVSTDGSRLLVRMSQDGENGASSLRLLTTSGEQVRTIALPFLASPDARHRPVFSAMGDEAIVLAGVKGGAPEQSQFHAVPFDGSAPRLLATVPGSMPWYEQFTLSPDGRTLAFAVRAAKFYTAVYELDVGALLRTSTR